MHIRLPDTAEATVSPSRSPSLSLDLALAPDEASRLPRLLQATRNRATTLRLIWHDTADGALAAEGLALLERRQGRTTIWLLQRILPGPEELAPPGTPFPVLAEAASPELLGSDLPADLTPIATLEGRARPFAGAGGVEAMLLAGTLHAGDVEGPCARLLLRGPAGAVATVVTTLASTVALTVPAASLAAEAAALAGRPLPPRRLGAPSLAARSTVGEAFAHIVAHLTDVVLHHAPAATAAQAPVPVHQMRVALRRLRSATGLFRRAVQCEELDAVTTGLKTLARTLGPARDWDVFTTGIGAKVGTVFPADPAITRMLAAAERRRQEAYGTLRAWLDGPEFRHLALALAMLAAARPWDAPGDGDGERARQARRLAMPLSDFASRVLERRLAPLRKAGDDVTALPVETLHQLRIAGKRLRYAAEFFAPLFPGRGTRRFIRRLTALQEAIGHLNDAAVAAGLLEEIGAAGSYAGGVVQGFVAAQAGDSRAEIARCWNRFHRLDPFWN
ncbi:Adenylate cyclase [Rhodovastum atsumiense]|uniref:CHAD domain-containing protein n=1 Tax=Rhodovastum atsumiense TaxID=504468 RepID=A0A5M6ITI4_9PROT|nr:CHAD domain-containing protein [Rhodovastum atsumiense]KAA5611137.1 CHAD domain-containing protein [Rhodovastum atsumiense]CAH2599210.1 Adenylate cyclase [Rhodovastum atsumiense]